MIAAAVLASISEQNELIEDQMLEPGTRQLANPRIPEITYEAKEALAETIRIFKNHQPDLAGITFHGCLFIPSFDGDDIAGISCIPESGIEVIEG